MIVYTAGPYRDRDGAYAVQQNIRQAEEVALQLWRAGYTVICPHKNTAMFDGAIPEDAILCGYLEVVQRCDLVVMLPGWELSEGSILEKQIADSEGIPVYEWPDHTVYLLNRAPSERKFTVQRDKSIRIYDTTA